MRAYSVAELFCMTRAELFALHSEIAAVLSRLPGASPERAIALETLRSIRRALAQIRMGP